MAQANWDGRSGWDTIADPTKQLNGRVLVAAAGNQQNAEDYLTQIAGGTNEGNDFTYVDYSVVCSYAWPAGSQSEIFSSGTIGLIARAGNYSDAKGTNFANNCYIGKVNYEAAKCQIVRRYSGVETILTEADIPASANTFGVKHTLEFRCVDDAPAVSLQLFIDGELAATIGDNSTSKISSGDSGLFIASGTVYVDNFIVNAYGSGSGGGGYSGATPSDFLDNFQTGVATYMRLWLKGDAGLAYNSNNEVTGWTDQATVISGTYIVGDGQTTNLPIVQLAALNGLNVIRFDHANHQFLKGAKDNTRLDFDASTYGGFFNVFYVVRFYKATIGDQKGVGVNTQVAPILNYGRSYQMYFNNLNDANPNRQHEMDNGLAQVATFTVDQPQYDLNNWAIYSYNTQSGFNASQGFFLNAQKQSETIQQPSNQDMDNANTRFHIGRKPPSETVEDYAYGSFDIAEIILVESPNTGVSGTIREKLEGYLAWKWGLVDLLPADHAYKSAAPTS